MEMERAGWLMGGLVRVEERKRLAGRSDAGKRREPRCVVLQGCM